jgi:hypothetical protein
LNSSRTTSLTPTNGGFIKPPPIPAPAVSRASSAYRARRVSSSTSSSGTASSACRASSPPSRAAAIALVFAAYAGNFVSLSEWGIRVVAALLILVVAAANCRSVRPGAAIQNASAAAKVIALARRSKTSGLVAKRAAKEPAAPETLDEESPATPWEREASNDSRGGTRTRDPGIMSSDEPPPEKTDSPSDDAP